MALKGESVHFDDKYLRVELKDGRVILTPMHWYAELQEASLLQLLNYQFICHDTGICIIKKQPRHSQSLPSQAGHKLYRESIA
ncbi:MAG: hypothetical protein methR_P2132 [Methyloprofundus sp.]|nr:MAG: hypothetical protein methR_P2132 [Methyloprofundus sp.]